MKDKLNIGIIGAGFMGRAHSNAWLDAPYYFDLPCELVRNTACDAIGDKVGPFARQFGWMETSTRWEEVVRREDIQVIDICSSNESHMPIAIEAARNGKHVICEKPMARDALEAKKMLDAVRQAHVCHMIAFNYRRVPAIVLARKMIREGRIGEIRHFNAVYYQDWLVDPEFPYVWRHDVRESGSGAHGDMNAHTVDLARYLVGEFEAVCGQEKIFIKERRVSGSKDMAKVTADDAMIFLSRFREGAAGNFMATRFATGRKNYLRLEIFGSRGSILFNLERLNELEYYSLGDPSQEQGFRNIIVTESSHPYLDRWWPPGHIIGWEHTFIHEIADFVAAIGRGEKIGPDFHDGLRCQQVLDAVSLSARTGKWEPVPEG
jgi:predicted dehydrogenase